MGTLSRYRERADLRAYLEVFLSLITISIFSLFALRPTLLTIAGLYKEIEAKEQTLSTMNKKIQDLSTARSLYDREIRNVQLLDTAIPKGTDPVEFVRQIEALSAKHRIETSRLSLENALVLGKESSLTISTSKKGKASSFPKDAGSIPVSVGTTVPIDQFTLLTDFLADFEYLRRPIKIDVLRLSVKRADGGNDMSLSIEGQIPYSIE